MDLTLTARRESLHRWRLGQRDGLLLHGFVDGNHVLRAKSAMRTDASEATRRGLRVTALATVRNVDAADGSTMLNNDASTADHFSW
eukprot:Skav212690  [mRNA]  locus=scaffold1930:196843:197100:- [translate_table: standard]